MLVCVCVSIDQGDNDKVHKGFFSCGTVSSLCVVVVHVYRVCTHERVHTSVYVCVVEVAFLFRIILISLVQKSGGLSSSLLLFLTGPPRARALFSHNLVVCTLVVLAAHVIAKAKSAAARSAHL